ncbi:MAG: hypothetical protein R2736_12815 [Solirubrobacterales bacterium]
MPTLAAIEAARLIAAAWPSPEPDRDALALGALLSGYAIDSQGYGLHHVAAQTLVREGGVGHGPANAVLRAHGRGAAPPRPDRSARVETEWAATRPSPPTWRAGPGAAASATSVSPTIACSRSRRPPPAAPTAFALTLPAADAAGSPRAVHRGVAVQGAPTPRRPSDARGTRRTRPGR